MPARANVLLRHRLRSISPLLGLDNERDEDGLQDVLDLLEQVAVSGA